MIIDIGTRSAKELCEPKELVAGLIKPWIIFNMFITNDSTEKMLRPLMVRLLLFLSFSGKLKKRIPNTIKIEMMIN